MVELPTLLSTGNNATKRTAAFRSQVQLNGQCADDLPASLSSSVSCSLYADNLAIWCFFPSVPTAVEATQAALFRLERWSEYWCLPLNSSKCEASFIQWIPTKLTSNPIFSYLAPASVSIPLQLHLGSPPTALFPLLNMYLR